jgi:probable F420-dependent oxidoreductase
MASTDLNLNLAGKDPIRAARFAERAGCAVGWLTEGQTDPFVQLAAASQNVDGLRLGTCVSVAFARNPMTTAYIANDLHGLTSGKFILGLGTQVRAHIEQRFSMQWSRPVERLGEMIGAIRAIWSAWNTESDLKFDGEFYSHTLMTPSFRPPPSLVGYPPIYVGAFGQRMCELAGTIADGILIHPFATTGYVENIMRPSLLQGIGKAGRAESDVKICRSVFVLDDSGPDEAQMRDRLREKVAFLASTRAYGGVMKAHGLDSVAAELNRLSRTQDEDRWGQMANLIDDDMLRLFYITASESELPGGLLKASEGVDRLILNLRYVSSGSRAQEIIREAKASVERGGGEYMPSDFRDFS